MWWVYLDFAYTILGIFIHCTFQGSQVDHLLLSIYLRYTVRLAANLPLIQLLIPRALAILEPLGGCFQRL